MSPRQRGIIIDRSGGGPWLTSCGDSVLPTAEWDITVLTPKAPSRAPDGMRVRILPEFNPSNLRREVEGVTTHGPLAGISTTSEHFLGLVAHLREEFGVVGHGVEYTTRMRDKWLMKQVAVRHGVPIQPGCLTWDMDCWLKEVDHKYGFVLKPRCESGAVGVRMLEDERALRRAVFELQHPESYIIEARSPHPIIHADVLVVEGEPLIEVSRYERPCHVSGGRIPLSSFTIDDEALRDEATALVWSIMDAWEVHDDVLHIELFADPSGLRLLELAGRPGAAGVPAVFEHTRGINLQHAKTQLDLGVDPRPFATSPLARHAGWTVIYAPCPGPVSVEDAGLRGHVTRRIMVEDTRIDGVAGLGVATYSFAADSVNEVRALISRYEARVNVRPIGDRGISK